MNVGMISDIPKVYTALAEWLSCIVYITVFKKSVRSKHIGSFLVLILFLLVITQILIGILPKQLWLLGMLIAVLIMYVCIIHCCDFSKTTAGYCCTRAFITAELVASLEWQLHFYFITKLEKTPLMEIAFFLVVYGAAYSLMYCLEIRRVNQNSLQEHFQVTKVEFQTAIAIGLASFTLSNLSYVYAFTPFSSQIATEVFNIRTLVCIGGFAFLYAHHIACSELHMKTELDAIQNILHSQYIQYRLSQENIDTLNRKYHDLKHQINVLRTESNKDKRNAYLDEMEEEIKDYEAQNKTGNAVLDTVLTGKSLYCAKHDIVLSCVADGTLLDSIYVMDICAIFGNALDNAIEYELQIPHKEKRLINVSVSSKNRFIIIRVENYFEGNLDIQNNFPVITKKNKKYHGYGIKSIQYSAQKYGGEITINIRNNWFQLIVLIPQ